MLKETKYTYEIKIYKVISLQPGQKLRLQKVSAFVRV